MNCPIIETTQQAIAIGLALGDVMHYSPTWASRLFENTTPGLTYGTGPDVLNHELQAQWNDYWSEAQKIKILTAFVMYRLAR